MGARLHDIAGGRGSAVTAPLRRARRLTRGGSHAESLLFRALDDISFSITSGSVVDIVGRNGAGKSTLLRALSRITEPTSGTIAIARTGREPPGSGHRLSSQLTGRENVYLNGSLLGMRRSEIARKFDEIVAFSEVESFLDTPVKRYSSGMYVRLAFAVAAHFEPEILIVDEILAVGDAAFQQKCLGKMQDVGARRPDCFIRKSQHGGDLAAVLTGAVAAPWPARVRWPDSRGRDALSGGRAAA